MNVDRKQVLIALYVPQTLYLKSISNISIFIVLIVYFNSWHQLSLQSTGLTIRCYHSTGTRTYQRCTFTIMSATKQCASVTK